MHKTLTALLMTLALTLPGCASLGQGGNPAAETISTIHEQYNGALAALEAYCAIVAPNDAEIAKVCSPALLTVHQTDGAIQAALGTITALLAKRAQSREGGMCTPTALAPAMPVGVPSGK